MVTPEMLRQKFSEGLEYDAYVATGSDSQRENWRRSREGVALDGKQRALVESFARDMKVLVVSGTWCGDCVRQCPMVHAIASANPRRIALRFVDRDRHLDLAERVMICGGLRVPTVLFLNEDFAFVSLLGDRTLASYRASAARHLGASCPLPGAPEPVEESLAVLADWLNEFERVALLLRLSPALRERHGD